MLQGDKMKELLRELMLWGSVTVIVNGYPYCKISMVGGNPLDLVLEVTSH